MKKLLSVILAVVLVFALGVTALASNNFNTSPVKGGSPSLISFEVAEGCNAKIIVTPEEYKHTLPQFLIAMMDDAYNQIINAEDLSDLCAALKSLAASKNIPTETLSVSELFDIRVEGCTEHASHDFDIIIKADSLKGYVGLLHYNGSDWELIDATVNGDHLHFSLYNFSPFAIVVTNYEGGSSSGTPATGDAFNIILCVAALVACAAVIVVLILKKKKENK